jgi:hypothetical protein
MTGYTESPFSTFGIRMKIRSSLHYALAALGLTAVLVAVSACGGGSASVGAAATRPVADTMPSQPSVPSQPAQPEQPAPASGPQAVVLAGSNYGDGSPPVDGTGAAARFNGIEAFAVDKAGVIYANDGGSCAVRKIALDGTVSTLAGALGQCGRADGPGAQARFSRAHGLAIDGDGNLYLGDDAGVRKITPDGVVSTLAGGGDPAVFELPRDGTGSQARFAMIQGVTMAPDGKLLVSDGLFNGADREYGALCGPDANTLRAVSLQGEVRTLPESVTPCDGSTPGPLSFAADLAYDRAGNLYLFRLLTIVKRPPDGAAAYLRNNQGALLGPTSSYLGNRGFRVAPDDAGNLYYLAFGVHKVTPDGTDTLVLAAGPDVPAAIRLTPTNGYWGGLTYVGNHQFLLDANGVVTRVTLH